MFTSVSFGCKLAFLTIADTIALAVKPDNNVEPNRSTLKHDQAAFGRNWTASVLNGQIQREHSDA